MRDLPSGTVTFLFTDVEGSTRLLHDHGELEYARLLGEHRVALREAFARHGGVEVDTQGDAFFAAFPRAAAATAAALDLHRALDAGPVQVRVGIHTGEPIVTDEGYVGVDVHRAARIAAAAHGGQTIVSRTTRDLLGQAPLRDLGEHRLKDLVQAERLYQLGVGEFPPLKTLDATNLPVTATSLLGREREVEELVALLGNASRLVTVTGPGGTGKTRLALQVAADLVGTMRDGVFWVPLASLSDPTLVVPEIAKTIGARDDLDGFLRGKQLLLLLDNLEHLAAAAPALGAILGASGSLRILATSRGPLRLGGERVYPLDPLPQRDAVALFLERADASGRRLEHDATVEAVCHRLEGLPLALELAAARTAVLEPETLLRRLDDALPVLTGGLRDAPERQRTLRATIAWSHDLLGDADRRLFARLAVFSGSFSVTAAEEICDATLESVDSLLDVSLVKAIGRDRFLLLDTVRQFAGEQLAAGDEETELRRRHAAAFAALAEAAYVGRIDAEEDWAARLELDHDNLRAALDHLTDAEPDLALAVAGALGWFWQAQARAVEGLERLNRTLVASTLGGATRARALTAAGALSAWQGDVPLARARMDEALALWRQLGDQTEEASALDQLGWVLVYVANDDEGALAAFEQSLDLRRATGDRRSQTRALVGIGQVLVAIGEVDRAETLSNDLLARAQADHDLRSEHFAYHFLADCALIRGDSATAQERYRESLRSALPLGDPVEAGFEIQGVAMAAAGLDDARRAVRLGAAVDALFESLGMSFSVPFWDALLERHIGGAAQTLGDDAELERANGRQLSFDQAVAEALAA